jgi:hypothetical protein
MIYVESGFKMKVFTLNYPGIFLKFEPSCAEVSFIITQIADSFIETEVAYNMYIHKQIMDLISYRMEYDERCALIRSRLNNKLLPDINEYAKNDLEARKTVWLEGFEPYEYLIAKRSIAAKTFVFGLDSIYKLINKLTEYENIPEEIEASKKLIENTYPHLIDIRNSIHHIEDRIRKKGKNEKDIELQPIENKNIKGTNILSIGGFSEDGYSITLADGTLGEIRIDESTVDFFGICIQDIINSFEWEGSTRYSPY